MGEGLFTADLFRFLEDLRTHNDRAWFAKNKALFQDVVQEPALEFVRSFGPYLSKDQPAVRGRRPSGGRLAVPHLPRRALLQGQAAGSMRTLKLGSRRPADLIQGEAA